ncbi:hypothetical protein EON66_06035 [archaeon]|nr:MAG: hypothetical protein EON66_06035 [archaeon]
MEAGAWPFLQPYAALVGLRDERQTLLAAAACMAVTGALTFLSLQLTVAPYGKYASSAGWWYGFKMPGKLAWMLQEAPAALWACWGCWVWCFAKPHASGAISSLFTTPQGILLAMFTFHYMNRAFVFPMRLRGGKPTPFVVFLMALFFCAYNGCVSARSRVQACCPRVRARTHLRECRTAQRRLHGRVSAFAVCMAAGT